MIVILPDICELTVHGLTAPRCTGFWMRKRKQLFTFVRKSVSKFLNSVNIFSFFLLHLKGNNLSWALGETNMKFI